MADPPLVLDEIAHLLADVGLGVYSPTAPGGDIFLGALPPDEPHAALAVALYGGTDESDSHHGYDEVYAQVRVRGPQLDALSAAARAQRVYDRLHGLPRRTLHGGTIMQSCIGLMGGPVYGGLDERGCHEWTVNFRIELRRVTVNRR